MRKYLPAVVLLTAIFGGLSFYIAKEVIASIQKKADIDKFEDKSKERWFQTFKDIDTEKKTITLKEIKTPFVLINFWASWCTPCLKEFPDLVELRKKIPEDKLFILGINCDEEAPESKVIQIKKKFNVNFPNVVDPQNKNLTIIGSNTLPATLLFHNGVLIFSSYKQTDFMNKQFLKMIDTP